MVLGDAQQYSKAMACRSHGYSLFHPPLFEDMQPGTVGYIDANGVWHGIAELRDSRTLEYNDLGEFEGRLGCSRERKKLGPVESRSVKSNAITLKSQADAVAMGLPVDVGGVVEYVTEASFGSVLMCDDEVEVECFSQRDNLVRWLEENHQAILKLHRDVKDHGIYAVRTTTSAKHVSIRSWSGAGQKISVGYKLGASGIGNSTSEVSYYLANHGVGWRQFHGEKRVVFFSGVKFRYNWLGKGREDRSEPAFSG
ncbi:hypothetical protein PG987_008862 [Apiospora arundinis]